MKQKRERVTTSAIALDTRIMAMIKAKEWKSDNDYKMMTMRSEEYKRSNKIKCKTKRESDIRGRVIYKEAKRERFCSCSIYASDLFRKRR